MDNPVRVRKAKIASIPFAADVIARAAFFARLHREANVEAWLKRVIQERIDVEEAAFAVERGFPPPVPNQRAVALRIATAYERGDGVPSTVVCPLVDGLQLGVRRKRQNSGIPCC